MQRLGEGGEGRCHTALQSIRGAGGGEGVQETGEWVTHSPEWNQGPPRAGSCPFHPSTPCCLSSFLPAVGGPSKFFPSCPWFLDHPAREEGGGTSSGLLLESSTVTAEEGSEMGPSGAFPPDLEWPQVKSSRSFNNQESPVLEGPLFPR